MRDLIFVGYLAALMLLAFKRPFLFTMVYAYIDIIAPQRLSYFMLNAIPLSLIAFLLALGGYMIADNKNESRFAPRQAWLLILLLYCAYTTSVADMPVDAQVKWDWVWKALVFAIFLPLTLKTKLRIETLALVMVLCASALIVTGGLKTIVGGGGYGVLVLLIDNNSGLYEGSIISCVAIAIIPLIMWLSKYGTIFPPDWRVKFYAAALIFACLLIPVGTQARTGLVCIAVLAILTLRYVKYRFLYLAGAALIGLAAIPFLPASFTGRMDTIQNYKADESASTRVAVWKWTIEYVEENPFGGGFDAYRQNKLTYDLAGGREPGFDGDDGGAKVVEDAGRAYHSSFFEMLGEQGYPGLIIWLIIHVGGVVRMEIVQRMYRRRNRAGEEWVAPLAIALQNGQIIYLVGSLFVGIAFQPFIYMLIGLQIGLDTYLARRRKEAAWSPIRNNVSQPANPA
ncbi:putative O-glycosylation ligase, exosortase A system-associated [Sphingorhabdus lutea]|uniref:Putative O-glycosylation ligase, exosortase A system-associated n=1 Tax=Sphingorhabdus lutea TaxID=1913578 RepID=A0A1L3JAI8_9SPHN|nr:putative O-glycosylation ligase, exosortase A system-associated [Sphingorhabdus lutea]APG62145.1 putative O-glycosylation ligase, exosortase A system-associated [Sphingorhabdus lutea]